MLAALLLTAGAAWAQEPAGQEEREPPGLAERAPRVEAPAAAGAPGRDEFLEAWARSYFPGRSGDILLVPAEGRVVTAPGVPFMHGSPWDYDTRVPLILYGPGHIRPGVYEAVASHQDVGATLEALLRLPRRPTTTGRILTEALSDRPGTLGEGSADGPAPPRAIVVLVLDGFRADYLERYAEETPNLDGLAERGAWFPRARTSVLPTATAVSHTTLVTATDPALHGITGNGLYDRVRRQSFSAYEDVSAANVAVLTLTDRWSAHTRGRAVIAAQGGTFYPAAALAGHGGCIFGGRPVVMAFFDSRTGGWSSNPDCFTLPAYLIDQNVQALLAAAAAEEGTTPSAARQLTDVFPRFEGDATVEILETEPFGEDGVTDLLLVNHKALDHVGHAHGPGSERMAAALAEVDRQVGRLLRALDARVGSGGYVLVVTSDHGMPDEPGEEGRHVHGQVVDAVNARFDPEGSGIVLHYGGADNQIYLDEERMEALGAKTAEVAGFLEALGIYRAAFTEEEVRRAADAATPAPADARTPPGALRPRGRHGARGTRLEF